MPGLVRIRKIGKKARRRPIFYFGAFLISLILTIAIIELGMALIAHLMYRDVEIPETTGDAPGAARFLIVCIGDSHTYGVGAPKGKDYPSTLQRLLNQRAGKPAFEVANLGRPGSNSSEALIALDDFIRTSPRGPDMVIMCGGKNNMNNLRHANILPETVRELPLAKRLDYMLSNSRTYSLTKMTVQRFEDLARDDTLPELEDSFKQGAFVPDSDEPFLHEWALTDFCLMADRCKDLGIPLVLLSYFMPVGFVDAAMQEAAERPGVLWVDQRFPAGAYFGYWGTLVSWPDQHPNAKGCYRTALILGERFIKDGLVPLPKKAGE